MFIRLTRLNKAVSNVIDGHPVPYSLTVPDFKEASRVSLVAETWLERHKPNMKLARVEGQYAFYATRT